MPDQKVIFISCGQYNEKERALGQEVQREVERLTDCRGYFAQNQSTLQALSTNVLNALYSCVGFIGIMHARGVVNVPGNQITRASVWVEQEIAIAAFIQEILKRPINVHLFIQEGIALEGIREKLILNPTSFSDDAGVIAKLREILPNWKTTIRPPTMSPLVAKLLDEKEARHQITVGPMVPTGRERLLGNTNWKHGRESCEILDVTEITLKVKILTSGTLETIPLDWLTPTEDYQQGQFMVLVKAQG